MGDHMAAYAIGIDFGTLSARALVARIADGREMGSAEAVYAHGVLETALMDGTPLDPDWAVQVPGDYTDALRVAVRNAVRVSGVSVSDIVGLGLDVTSNTILPLTAEGKPLAESPEFSNHPYAQVMLWKHHAAQPYADQIERAAKERGEAFLHRYGGVSAEWMLPKLMQQLAEAPEIVRAADRFMEVGDWLVMLLCGQEACSEAMAGYKMFWSREAGYPSAEYLDVL